MRGSLVSTIQSVIDGKETLVKTYIGAIQFLGVKCK